MEYKNLKEALTDLCWRVIDKNVENPIDLVQEIFNPNELDDDNSPVIVCKKKTILVCDNIDWNETYLIDLVAGVLKDNEYLIDSYDLVYCDNIIARTFIEKREEISPIPEEEISDYEKKNLTSCVFIINPDMNLILHVNDSLAPINEKQIDYLLGYLNNSVCNQRIHQ